MRYKTDPDFRMRRIESVQKAQAKRDQMTAADKAKYWAEKAAEEEEQKHRRMAEKNKKVRG